MPSRLSVETRRLADLTAAGITIPLDSISPLVAAALLARHETLAELADEPADKGK